MIKILEGYIFEKFQELELLDLKSFFLRNSRFMRK